MRKKIVAGNWKMNNTLKESILLADNILKLLTEKPINDPDARVVLAPPFISIEKVGQIMSGQNNVFLAAQNCHSMPKGAYTGEVSVKMLKEVGCTYIIIGHSERRAYFREDDSFLADKASAIIEEGLHPIFCCGEQLSERQGGAYHDVVEAQISNALFHFSEDKFRQIVIAYEPVWAIGTGVTATSQQAQEMHAFIRQILERKYGFDAAKNTSILYGGSCNAKNAAELFSNKDVDGGLIGGASLIAEDFVNIIHNNL